MKIIGFNFTKISAEKKKDNFKDLKANNSINILNISEIKQEVIKTDEDILAVKFSFGLDYSPDIANIEFQGNILLSLEQKMAKEVLKKWKSEEVHDDFKIPLFNIIFRKSSLKALEIEDELNLPLHIQMPALRKSEDSKK